MRFQNIVKTSCRFRWGIALPPTAFCVLMAIVTLLISHDVIACQGEQVNAAPKSEVLSQLQTYLDQHQDADFSAAELAEQDFAKQALSAEESRQAAAALVQHHRNWIKKHREAEFESRVIKIGSKELPFWYKVYGEKPEGGRSLFISMHGGGGAPKAVNDRQWDNQKKLYKPEEGVYVAPRAPVDAWNMWHVAEVDQLFQRLVEEMIVLEDVNPDRVYLMGYSAGGDGVYQIAPRWADHLAAAAMMAGHPNETTADGLRNLPFCLQMGGKDSAYDRNKIAGQWEGTLKQLQEQDPKGYLHLVKIYPDFGHWMNGEDAIAVPWMAKFDRQRFPDRIVWKQDDVTHRRFYWLTNDDPKIETGARVVVEREGQTITVVETEKVKRLGLLLDDQMPGLNLDQPITIKVGNATESVTLNRTVGTLAETLWQRGDPRMMMSAKGEIPQKD